MAYMVESLQKLLRDVFEETENNKQTKSDLVKMGMIQSEKIKKLLNRLKITGFYSVFVSSVFTKIVTFFGGVILVRIMSKEDYGLYTYVMNSYGILFVLSDFGFCQAMLQYRSESFADKLKSNDYYTFTYRMGMVFSCVSAFLLFFSPLFYPFKYENVAELTRCLCLLPFITTANSFLLNNLRVQTQNTRYAAINVLQTLIHYGIIVPLSFFWQVAGAIIANYLIGVLTLLISIAISHKYLGFDWHSNTLSTNEKKGIFKFAFGSQLNSSIGAMFHLVDVFFIGLFIANADVISSYKIATSIPSALMFIPNSILIYVVPSFARYNKDKYWVRRNYKILLLSCMVVNGGIAIIIAALSPRLVPLIYGDQYKDAVLCSIILIAAFFFSGSLHAPSANIIYTQHKIRVNIIITVITNMINCILDVFLIMHFGSIGAAVATLLVSLISGVLSTGYMISWIKE